MDEGAFAIAFSCQRNRDKRVAAIDRNADLHISQTGRPESALINDRDPG
jgi:hypothetical protein